MINLVVEKSDARAVHMETLASGTAQAVYVRFCLSEHWDGLRKTAVFTNGETTIDVLDSKWLPGDLCPIPQEVLQLPGKQVRVGLHGVHNRQLILATPMVGLGSVVPGTDPSEDPTTDPSLPVWQQLREDLNTRSHACSTVLEKYRSEVTNSTVLRIKLINPQNIPAGATLDLYRQVRRHRCQSHWEHPKDWKDTKKGRHQKWGYGLIAELPYACTGDDLYPPVPDWMPQDGYLKTTFTISQQDKAIGYIEVHLDSFLVPLLKPVDAMLEWHEVSFIGLEGDGRDNSLVFRFRICKDGAPVDDPGDILKLGFRRNYYAIHGGMPVVDGKVNTSALYTSIE